MTYEGNIFRPPSEAYSLLIQVTIGCSHNKCTFCSMYKDKKFKIRRLEDIKADLEECARKYQKYDRIFLCDGNALIMKTEDLVQILKWIKELFPNVERIGAYAQPKDILLKTTEELKTLYDLGLKILYVGLESGSDEVLNLVEKGVTKEQMIECAKILKPSGIKSSIMVITGLGGQEHWQSHAYETAEVLNQMQPDYLGLLALMVERNTKLYDDIKNGSFKLLTPKQIVVEMKEMVKGLELNNCLFSSIHASNYINLRGVLPGDKQRLLSELDFYLENERYYKPEGARLL